MATSSPSPSPKSARPTTAMVLAAGHGTRLKPLTHERPKPLLEVLGRPLAAYALDHARRIGAKRAVLNTHHLGGQISKHFRSQHQAPQGRLALSYSRERTLLGTGGGLKKMWEHLLAQGPVEGPVLVLNADALIDLDTDALVAAFQKPTPKSGPACLSAMVLQEASDAERYGVIGTNARGRVVHFAGRADAPDGGDVVKKRMFCGVHLVDPSLFDMIPPPPYGEGGVCINRLGYPPAIAGGEVVRGVDHRGIFWDVGTPERLLEANLRLLGGLDRLKHSDPFAGLLHNPAVSSSFVRARPRLSRTQSGRVYMGRNVRIAVGANITGPVLLRDGAIIGKGANVGPYAVVGENARVGPRADVSYSVLLKGASVTGGRTLRGTILGKKEWAYVPDPVVESSLNKRKAGARS